MKKNYIVPQIEDVKLDPLMQTLDIAGVGSGGAQVQTADAPSRGREFNPL